ncbi:MAG: c-type cytochrome [Vicinamibacterales bacterium]
MSHTRARLLGVSLLAVAAGLMAGLVSPERLSAQDPPKIWTGVFSEAQAKRGHDVFVNRCAHCHDERLTGGEGPALVGGQFNRSWGSRTLQRLFVKIKDRMPPGEVFAATDKEKLDIVAFILMMNGFPPGSRDLPMDAEELSSLLIVGKNGPEPAPTGSMVEVVGCLTTEGTDFVLTNATEPVVSTMDDPAGDAKAFKGPLGTGKVKLLDVFPKPDALKGHTLMAKGLLIRNGDAINLNVLALDSVAKTCP